MENANLIEKIASHFAIDGKFLGGEEVVSGHINATYIVSFQKSDGRVERYIIQLINDNVFKDSLAVMRNVEMVTRHINQKVLRAKRDQGGQTLSLYPARDGKFYVKGQAGGLWRCYNFIEGCMTYDTHAFGAFQDLVSDISVHEITETIPDFHNTAQRYARLMEVVAQDPKGRLASVQAEVDFIQQREVIVSKLLDLKDAGLLPERVTHNDTKINNVMMDIESDEAVCVIDLDTVMPGLSLYDFGDLVRTAVSPAAEDELDLSKVEVRMPIFEALVEGYMLACDCLCEAEIENLAFSGKLISLETGIRFLTDHLEGDVYFKTKRENHNLDRARTQLKLVEKLEQKEREMEDYVRLIAEGRV